VLLKGGTSTVARFALAARPGSILALDRSPEDAQNCSRDRVAHSATVFPVADVQAVMGTIFNAPVLPSQFEQTCYVGLVLGQAGDEPNRFNFLPAGAQLANALQARQLYHMRKAHLLRREGNDFDAAPFDPAVTDFDLQELRGKNLPAGSVVLV
jgi:hypothetical protein